MYFFNKDGHDGNNRFRDFLVTIYPANVSWSKFSDAEYFDKLAESQSRKLPLARTRVNNFLGGVHKNFVLNGEGKYFVHVDNNFSYCTIMSSVCVDKLQGDSTTDNDFELSLQLNVPYHPPQFPAENSQPVAYQSKKLWELLDVRYDKLETVEIERELKLHAIQTIAELPDTTSAQIKKTMCWRLNLLDNTQQINWNNTINEIQNRLTKQKPQLEQQQETLKNKKSREIWKNWKK
jgi:hypothetical protein